MDSIAIGYKTRFNEVLFVMAIYSIYCVLYNSYNTNSESGHKQAAQRHFLCCSIRQKYCRLQEGYLTPRSMQIQQYYVVLPTSTPRIEWKILTRNYDRYTTSKGNVATSVWGLHAVIATNKLCLVDGNEQLYYTLSAGLLPLPLHR